MAMIALDERLPCGVALETLLIQVADQRPLKDPAHQASCPYCQAALRRLEQGWEDLQAVARQPVAIPEGLTAKIMTQVRALAGYVADSILLGHPRGETRISHAVIGALAQHLALRVPGVVFASARLHPQESTQPRRVKLALKLVVAFGPAIEMIVDALRENLRRRIPALTGAELDRIDITISDIARPLDGYERQAFLSGE
ncbi:MAG: Asp23/Gls24 family envelope stress response protein [Solirubrobacterales bacterium]|nr:Asp23/Gls24 family envelope stress response protein [Solirubrobacterales bacterium]